jgi:hypothetical protein
VWEISGSNRDELLSTNPTLVKIVCMTREAKAFLVPVENENHVRQSLNALEVNQIAVYEFIPQQHIAISVSEIVDKLLLKHGGQELDASDLALRVLDDLGLQFGNKICKQSLAIFN